ncbi:sugar nucleotide-binding protein, partial [Loktanella sp. DJP18]|uniref:sugar nucleotide-binding protein n=1 Tax=Loktanella sp. DJP18 TaxID=3409788 RepID=UPI003BB714C2
MILVFGQSGQVARALSRDKDVVTLSRRQADLSDPEACGQAIRQHRPVGVINAAAWTAVDAAEEQEAAARVVNADAPAAMATACAALDIPFVHISTDYVFPGDGDRAWHRDDVCAPLQAYGRTKRAGELAV